jgi:hypothetical protein
MEIKKSAREQLQEAITNWIQVLQEGEENLRKMERGSGRFEIQERFNAEYRGRIYAARRFGDLLGYEFDTEF